MIAAAMLGVVATLGGAHAGPSPELTFGGKTRPAGIAVLSDLWFAPAPDLNVGPGLDVYFYWYNIDFRARGVVYGGFLVLNGWAGVEPGWFKRADDRGGPRQFELRPLARARVEVNLRNDWVWLYLRNTGWTRYRSAAEFDPFRDQVFARGAELSGEHSTALMFSPSGSAERKLWIYGEITLEASVDVGWLDRLPRAGVLVEKLSPTVSIDLDAYWSLMANAVGGPGGLVVVWWTPGAG